jgi:hypothetical protein
MRMRLLVLPTLSLWICSTTASGQGLTWTGPGAVSCTEYAKAVRSAGENMRLFYFSWAQGFMSGLNTAPMLLGKGTNLAARAHDGGDADQGSR